MILDNVITSLWREIIDWYIRKCRNWSILSKLASRVGSIEKRKQLLDTAYGLWGHIWHESDLILLFSHKLLEYIESRKLDLHLHINYELKPTNFRVMKSFYRRLCEAVRYLRAKLKMSKRWFPEIDLIIAEDKPPFIYCLEFKYYHYLPATWNIIDDLKRKIAVLEVSKMYNVCKSVGLLLLDDTICRRDQLLCSELKNILGNVDKHILVLDYYVSYNELNSILNGTK